jgi:hypothetical protein
MAWCENEYCRKNGLRKADVEFDDDTHKILCHGCYSLLHPGWIPPAEYVDLTDAVPKVVRNVPREPHLGFAFQITDAGGIKAQVSYGGASIALQAPMEELKNLFKG